MKTDTRKVVSVMSFNSVMEAQLYKALLESAGISARMQNDLAAQVIPAFGALMQINLLVAEEDQRKAREIIGAKFDIDEFQRQSSESKKEQSGTQMANEARKSNLAEKKATKTAVAAKKTAEASKKSAPKATVKRAGAAKAAAVRKPAAKKAQTTKKTAVIE